MPLPLGVPAARPLPEPGTPDAARRRTVAGYGVDDDPVQPRRRRPFAAIAVGAAVAAVVATAAFAGGLFTAADTDMEALPSAPVSAQESSSEPANAVSESPPASASASPSASATPSTSASPSASPSVSASPSKSAKASRSASATTSVTTAPAPSSASAPAPEASTAPPPAPDGATLRPGDSGSGVVELQRRLREVWLYHGPHDGVYSDQVRDSVAVFQSYRAVQDDPRGVYGPNTRRALEAETSGRGRN
ncbi:hypothetical protein Sfulv_16190 [Streptomyces fulvorobeus]|nr:peptidoglycan-binding domain-containing protein [Streptomyces fulvorobeus]GFM96808.1 hypothetical protein Sfulv_16190 [Streptomyces fulvorobeus]